MLGHCFTKPYRRQRMLRVDSLLRPMTASRRTHRNQIRTTVNNHVAAASHRQNEDGHYSAFFTREQNGNPFSAGLVLFLLCCMCCPLALTLINHCEIFLLLLLVLCCYCLDVSCTPLLEVITSSLGYLKLQARVSTKGVPLHLGRDFFPSAFSATI